MFHVKHPDLPGQLPELELHDFAQRLARACRAASGSAFPELPETTHRTLHAHYTELRRWSRRLALIGSGSVPDVLQRHYAESLAALPLLPPPTKSAERSSPPDLVDIGSGAGFPGWVLAAARPDLTAHLVEARERKWAFLQAATRRAQLALPAFAVLEPASAAGLPRHSIRTSSPTSSRTSLPIECLNARVDLPLPEALPAKMDIVTVRALNLDHRVLAALARRMPRQGRFLFWLGAEGPRLPPGLHVGRELPLGGTERRRILELVPTT